MSHHLLITPSRHISLMKDERIPVIRPNISALPRRVSPELTSTGGEKINLF
jgi:hypothetical protein